ncbi:MAG: class I SAM-dependent methyltransferase [Nanoarchaeota archaeon]|nr:class I SAM-dependent methyltransferase [Nanoarchaeota archaeon]
MVKTLFPTNKNEPLANYIEGILSKYVSLGESKVLEIGCGNGRFGVVLGGRVGSYSGIDPDKEYIEIARKNFSEINYKVGSAEDIPFDEKFDVLFYSYSWHFILDFDEAYSEMRRVLDDDGIVFIMEPKGEDSNWASPVLNRGTPEFNEDLLKRKLKDLERGRKAILENNYFDVVEEIDERSKIYLLKKKK